MISSSCCWRQVVFNQPWGGQVSSGRDCFKQSQQTNIWPESLVFTPLVTEGLENDYWKAMFLHFNVQEYIHTQFAVEDPKSPTREHHPDTELPKAMNWSLLLIVQNTNTWLQGRSKPNPTLDVKLTWSNQRDKRNSPFCRLFLGPLPWVMPVPAAVPLRGGEPRVCTQWLPKVVWLKIKQLHQLGWMS